jgi:hypothetical protein
MSVYEDCVSFGLRLPRNAYLLWPFTPNIQQFGSHITADIPELCHHYRGQYAHAVHGNRRLATGWTTVESEFEPWKCREFLHLSDRLGAQLTYLMGTGRKEARR